MCTVSDACAYCVLTTAFIHDKPYINRSLAECKRGCVVVGAPDFRPLPSGFAAALPGAKVHIVNI
jgi:hypothetical protein